MLARLALLVVVLATLGCGGGSGAPDGGGPCEVDEGPAEAFTTCGQPVAQCCGLPWCGPDVPSNAWYCASHGTGVGWCCACSDVESPGAPKWGLWKMECGLLGQHDGGGDALPDAGTD